MITVTRLNEYAVNGDIRVKVFKEDGLYTAEMLVEWDANNLNAGSSVTFNRHPTLKELSNEVLEYDIAIEIEESYYSLWIGDNQKGRWNVIQVIGENARYYVLKGSLEEAEIGYMLSIGWIQDDSYTDGEETIILGTWKKTKGTLVPF